MAFDNLIGQSPFLSKIQGFFAHPITPVAPQPGQPSILPQAPMPQQPQPQQRPSNGQQGGDLLSSLLKNDTDGSSIISKIVSLFGG